MSNDQATYSPEDNKLRLYVGRVPRDEYEALRAQGWTSTPKQDCDFVATWTPAREDMAIDYADEIDDEDQSPEDRAADRAERFGDYRDKRRDEACCHASTFDAGPSVHGFQSQDRAERSARRHDRSRVHAVSQWAKAEYWQRRTEGVILHALYKSSPRVRRSRILRLEAEQRKHLAAVKKSVAIFRAWQRVEAETEPKKAFALAYVIANRSGGGWFDYEHPRTGRKASLYDHLTDASDPITGTEAAALALARYDGREPCQPGSWSYRWAQHYELRLAYEKQMLEAEGGMSGDQDIIPGGRFGGRLIVKTAKSHTTGRVVSVQVKYERVTGWTYQVKNVVGCDFSLAKFEVERHAPEAYKPPTPADLAELAEVQRAMKAGAKKANAGTPKLINPTQEAAQALQDHINANARGFGASDQQSATVAEMTQAEYSVMATGRAGARAETHYLRASGVLDRCSSDMYVSRIDKLPIVCKLRVIWRGGGDRVVILTDKPQKALPDWQTVPQAAQAQEVEA